tara:strand:+ start:1833 stop:2180 length:348 start_codon:yes stop_codon:yes gene_type:complete
VSKKNIIDEDPELERKYLPFITNKFMASFLDIVLFANEMNINWHLDKKLQYDFYLNTVRSKKRYSPWLRKEELSNLDCIKKYYGYSNEKARQVLPLLSEEQIEFIKSKLNVGGLQ